MSVHKYQGFTTFDRDNDIHPRLNCAVRHFGAWWYKECYRMILHGAYGGTYDFGICLWNPSIRPSEIDCNI
ncbi:Tenascin-N [Holothuria leucospilota]|uniref:Tenascin-N n=1 Tax=Holothuria leucospilota TaxID=206669 RepID=A0A9Q1BUF8_HOLLE|nr:Tenascin-N [Holothuria leucospilota]